MPPKSKAYQDKSKRSQCVCYKTASIPKTSWNPVLGAAAPILAAGDRAMDQKSDEVGISASAVATVLVLAHTTVYETRPFQGKVYTFLAGRLPLSERLR